MLYGHNDHIRIRPICMKPQERSNQGTTNKLVKARIRSSLGPGRRVGMLTDSRESQSGEVFEGNLQE
jgi:hypothetical protein